MATAVTNPTDEPSDLEQEESQDEGSEEEKEDTYAKIGVLAGLEFSSVPNTELTDRQKNLLKEIVTKGAKRDYPARLVEVIATWEAALFYRGFQFLIPQRGGGWVIPGESTGYGPSMQMDLALLPTNIYSARGQMLIAALTRTVPNVRWAPEPADSDAGITAADSAEKFAKVIKRNNDLMMVQTDASRYLYTDGRFGYWSRFVKDGQRFGWEEDDEPDDVVPEDEPTDQGQTSIESTAAAQTPESSETEETAEAKTQVTTTEKEAGTPEEAQRTPRGQEVRTAHGKLEMKLVPMMANDIDEVDMLFLEMEVDEGRAKGMLPWIADKIKATQAQAGSASSGEIARLARQNVKLGMQSTYVTSDSMGSDVTIQRCWMRPNQLTKIEDEDERNEMIEMFPNGCYVVYAGEEFAFARNESMDDCWALGQAYSGDGQNRNAMGTSTLPIQKRLNNWLDLMNDIFVRTIPKKWMDSKTFSVETLRQQTNIPGDIGSFKRQGVPVDQLIFVEPAVNPPANLADFIKEYSGPLAELLSGAYPALAGGDVGTADSGVAIATQRDSALGRLAPTWHSMKNAEAKSMKQLIRWAAKCRDKSINEKIPGGETITIETNDLKANILCFAESDENFPETYTQRKNGFTQIFDAALKNPQLGEILFNPANLELCRNMTAMGDFVIPQVLAYRKQLGEIEAMLKGSGPVPNPAVQELQQKVLAVHAAGVDPTELQPAAQQIGAMPPEICALPIDPKRDDNATEAMTCWLWINGEEGRKAKRAKPKQFEDICLHYDAHVDAAAAKAAQQQAPGKPPSESINFKDVAAIDMGAATQLLAKGGITPTAGGAAPSPVPAPAGAHPPAAPIPTGAPEHAGGSPKL